VDKSPVRKYKGIFLGRSPLDPPWDKSQKIIKISILIHYLTIFVKMSTNLSLELPLSQCLDLDQPVSPSTILPMERWIPYDLSLMEDNLSILSGKENEVPKEPFMFRY